MPTPSQDSQCTGTPEVARGDHRVSGSGTATNRQMNFCSISSLVLFWLVPYGMMTIPGTGWFGQAMDFTGERRAGEVSCLFVVQMAKEGYIRFLSISKNMFF
jgi:hypothetical protein